MPPPQEAVKMDRQKIHLAFQKARMITGMIQGTMGLEGQGLDRKSLRALTKMTVKELLEIR